MGSVVKREGQARGPIPTDDEAGDAKEIAEWER